MSRLEKEWEQDLCHDVLRDFGVPNKKINADRGGETGWPDRIFFIPGGSPLIIECKRDGKPTSAKQDYIINMLRGLGYDVEVYDNYEEAYGAIRARVEAAQVSKDGGEVSARASKRRSAAGPRPRQNERNARRL